MQCRFPLWKGRMKKQNLGGLVFLFAATILAVWLNLDDLKEYTSPETATVERQAGRYTLAVSWQPAFCEMRPNKAECRSQRKGRFDTQYFSLHGLWPETLGRQYCGIDQRLIDLDKRGRWSDLPALQLSTSLREELALKMPGYRSHLHRHEWYKHGSCMAGYSQEDYFRISLALLDQLNASPVARLLADNPGREFRFTDLGRALDDAFGDGARDRMTMDCYRDNGRRIIQELKLSIAGRLEETSSLAQALAAGERVGRSCPRGIADPAGLQ